MTSLETTGVGRFEELIASQKALHRGDLVMGRVVAVNSSGAWVSIGSKTEAIIPPGEMRTAQEKPVHPGEEVLVYVLEPAREEGQVLLSLDQARRYQGWHKLEQCLASGELVEGEVAGSNRGGLVVNCEGISGFVPNSQVLQQGQERTGQRIQLKVMELNPKRLRLILSERMAFRIWRERERDRVLAELKEGEVRQGRITGVFSFGAFVDLGGVEGLVPLSELSWERDKAPGELVQVGQEITALVMKVDPENKKLVLSAKRTQPHPWETINEKFQVGQKVEGKVVRLMPFGAFVRLDGGIEGLVHISELAQRRITHPKEVVREEQTLSFKVIGIDPEKRQMRLSLRQAVEEEEPLPRRKHV